MRILRVVGSAILPCGCLVGRYETYDGRCVELVDRAGARCTLAAHHYRETGSVGARMRQWVRRAGQALHLAAH